MKTYRIAAIPGDGIGTEVVSAGVEVLRALAQREGSFQFKVDHFDWGGEYYKKHGRMMPENGRSLIQNHDAILFGSAGHPDIPDHITLWGLRLAVDRPTSSYAVISIESFNSATGSRATFAKKSAARCAVSKTVRSWRSVSSEMPSQRA
jgi:isocitrate/isopropylmalate dehydrogenase